MEITSLSFIIICAWVSKYTFTFIVFLMLSYYLHEVTYRFCTMLILLLTWILSDIYISPNIQLLHNLYIHLQTMQCINCIIKCNIVPYSYLPQCSVSTYPVYTSTNYAVYMDIVHHNNPHYNSWTTQSVQC